MCHLLFCFFFNFFPFLKGLFSILNCQNPSIGAMFKLKVQLSYMSLSKRGAVKLGLPPTLLCPDHVAMLQNHCIARCISCVAHILVLQDLLEHVCLNVKILRTSYYEILEGHEV